MDPMNLMIRTAGLFALGLCATVACAKSNPDVAPANAAAGKIAEKPAAADDNSPPPGVDLANLDDFERKVFLRILNKESSACGKAHSLMVSVKTDKVCRKSMYAAKYVARLVDAGYTDSEVAEMLQKRFRGEPPKAIDLKNAAVKGNPNAPVTLVEFVDYECPHCKRVQPVLRQVMEEFSNQVKVVFKHYPLGQHTNARLAAEAAVAAQRQGKFWAYNDKIWENSESLTPALLEQLAKDAGLDVAKWRKDLESAEVKEQVMKDREDGTKLGIQSTPSIFINGRTFSDNRDEVSLRDWINEELGR